MPANSVIIVKIVLNPDTSIGLASTIQVYAMPDEFLVYYNGEKAAGFASLETLFDFLVDEIQCHGVVSAIITNERLAEMFMAHELIIPYSILLGRQSLLILSPIFSQTDIETLLSEADVTNEMIHLNASSDADYIADTRYKGIIN